MQNLTAVTAFLLINSTFCHSLLSLHQFSHQVLGLWCAIYAVTIDVCMEVSVIKSFFCMGLVFCEKCAICSYSN